MHCNPLNKCKIKCVYVFAVQPRVVITNKLFDCNPYRFANKSIECQPDRQHFSIYQLVLYWLKININQLFFSFSIALCSRASVKVFTRAYHTIQLKHAKKLSTYFDTILMAPAVWIQFFFFGRNCTKLKRLYEKSLGKERKKMFLADQ